MSIFNKLFGKKECGCSCRTEVKEEPKFKKQLVLAEEIVKE